MALSDYLKRGQIGPSLKGQYYQYERNGHWVTAKWPKKRGPARSQKQKNAEIAFAEACFAMKRTASEIQMFHRENAKGTPMLPRDSLMAALYGNGPAIHFYNGKVIKPMANKYLASTVLDAIGWQPGMVLYRGADTWNALLPPSEEMVLSFSPGLKEPVWIPYSSLGVGKKRVVVPYTQSASASANIRGNVYRFSEAVAIDRIAIAWGGGSGQGLYLHAAAMVDSATIGPVVHNLGLVSTGAGSFEIVEHVPSIPLVFSSYEFFAVWCSRTNGSGTANCDVFDGQVASSNVLGTRALRAFWPNVAALTPGDNVGGSSLIPRAISLEFK